MTKKLCIRSTLIGMLITANGAALAVNEIEPNDTPASAQQLVIGSDGTAQVTGIIGISSSSLVDDVDFYSFRGYANNAVTIDIDGGMLDADCIVGLDSTLTLLAPDGTVLAQSTDNFVLDDGSVCGFDPRIDNQNLPVDGTYLIAVTGNQDVVLSANSIVLGPLGANSNGPYTMLISGVNAPAPQPAPVPQPVPAPQPQVQHINIEVRPGSREIVPLNPAAKGVLPVALLSSTVFNALNVDTGSLRFGATGKEDSLVRCNKEGVDVNHDGLPDLLCQFDNQKAKFQVGDTQAFVTGTNASKAFDGQGWLKVVAGKRRKR